MSASSADVTSYFNMAAADDANNKNVFNQFDIEKHFF